MIGARDFRPSFVPPTRLPNCIVDGEVVALDEDGSPDFAALQAALSSGDAERLIYFAFDLLFLEGEDLRSSPLKQRKQRLESLIDGSPHDPRLRYVDHFETTGDAALASACRMGLEGIISKRLDSPYRSGRSGEWTKSKCRGGQEVVIGGWSHDAGRLRSLLVGVYRDKQLTYVGRVGTGFGRDKSGRLVPQLKKLVTQENPFVGKTAPRKAAGIHWVKPRLVAEIEFAGGRAPEMCARLRSKVFVQTSRPPR